MSISAPEDGSHPSAAEIDASERRSAGVIGLLIVDDIPETVDYLSKLFGGEPDISVLGVATNGDEAIEAARRLRPDVVLLDHLMPVKYGIDATPHIIRDQPTVAVIIMSVLGDADTVERAMQAGASRFLVKPFSSAELMSAIRNPRGNAPVGRRDDAPQPAGTPARAGRGRRLATVIIRAVHRV
jgi:CheY-like chemotaxis protein